MLAHDFGAAREVLGERNPPVNANDSDNLILLANKWLDGLRPDVSQDPRFDLTTVLSGWRSFLNDPDSFIEAQQPMIGN